MKTLGIIGGIGPESTIEYYRLIIRLYRDRVQEGSYPELIINSIDMKKMLDLAGAPDPAGLTAYMLEEVQKLAKAGADFGLISSNTPHLVFDEINRDSPIPLISIVEATYAAVKARGLDKVGLFGTRFTMQGKTYREVFSREGITLVVPNPDEQATIHEKYMSELVHGVVLLETRSRLLTILDGLIDGQGIQGLILGGTELPLILRDATYRGIPLFDTTRIHAESAVEMMLS